MNYTITKENGISKITTAAKSEVSAIITEALTSAFGGENVAMVRTGGSSPSNMLAVRVGTLTDEEGFSYDLCVTLNVTAKSHKEKVTKKYTVEAFDFDSAREAYEEYLREKAEAEAERAKKAKTKSKSGSKKEKERELAEAEAKTEEKLTRLREKRESEEKAKRYRIEVDGKTAAKDLTFEEAKAKSNEFVNGEKVKIFEQ